MKKIEFYNWGTNIIGGNLYIPTIIWAVLMISTTITIFIQKYIKSQGIEKLQLRYLFLGFLLFLVCTMTTNLILPAITGVNEYAKFGPYFIIFLITFTAYAITRHRLIGMEILIRKSVVYSLLVFIALIIVTFITIFMNNVIAGWTQESFITATIITSLIIAFGFHPLKRFIEKYIGKLIFSSHYDYKEITARFSKSLDGSLLLKKFAKALSMEIMETLRVQDVRFFVIDRNTKSYSCLYSTRGKDHSSLDRKDHLVFYLKKKPSIIIADEIPMRISNTHFKAAVDDLRELQERLKELHTAAVVPISDQYSHEIITIVLLGPKLSKDAFTEEDIKTLSFIMRKTSKFASETVFYRDVMLRTKIIRKELYGIED